MRYYELIYIINSNVERNKVNQVMKDISSRLERTESKIINHVVWGKKKLSYAIKGNTYGNFILLHYEGGDNKKISEFDSWLKLSGLVLRHMIVKLEEKPDIVKDFDEEKSENNSKQDSQEPTDEKEITEKDKEVE